MLQILRFSLAVSSLDQILLWWMDSKNGRLKALLTNVDAVGVCDIWSVWLINPRRKIVGSLGRSCKKMKPWTVGSPRDRQAQTMEACAGNRSPCLPHGLFSPSFLIILHVATGCFFQNWVLTHPSELFRLHGRVSSR